MQLFGLLSVAFGEPERSCPVTQLRVGYVWMELRACLLDRVIVCSDGLQVGVATIGGTTVWHGRSQRWSRRILRVASTRT